MDVDSDPVVHHGRTDEPEPETEPEPEESEDNDGSISCLFGPVVDEGGKEVGQENVRFERFQARRLGIIPFPVIFHFDRFRPPPPRGPEADADVVSYSVKFCVGHLSDEFFENKPGHVFNAGGPVHGLDWCPLADLKQPQREPPHPHSTPDSAQHPHLLKPHIPPS